MALEGEPLKSRSAVLLYAVQTVKGTPVTPNLSAGIASFDMTSDTDLRDIYTLGKAGVHLFKPGFGRVDWNIAISHLQTKAWIQQGTRTAGVLPWLTIAFGYRDDSGQVRLWQVQDNKIGSLDLGIEQRAPWTAGTTGIGGIITDVTSGAAAHLAQDVLMAYETTIAKAAAAWESASARIAVNHNLDPKYPIYGVGETPTTGKRLYKYLPEGKEQISWELVRWARSQVNLQANTISEFDLGFVATDIAGGMSPNAITINLLGSTYATDRISASDDPDTDILFSGAGRSKTWSVP